MKMKLLAVLATGVLLASGCATDGTIGVGGHAVSLSTADEKAMIAAEATFQAVLIAVNAGVDSGALKGANAATVRDRLVTAKRALDAARAAQRVADGVRMAAGLSDFTGAISATRAIIGR